MNYKIINAGKSNEKITRIITNPVNEAFEIYISIIDKHLIPIFIEHHILAISFPLESGTINYYEDLDWEDLKYIDSKFGKIDNKYIYIYTYIGYVVDNIMLKSDFNEIVYHYAKTIYDNLKDSDITEIQESYSLYLNWWINNHQDNCHFENRVIIYQAMSKSWEIAMKTSLERLKILI